MFSIRFFPLKFVPIFHFKLCSFVGGGTKNFFPRAQETLATPCKGNKSRTTKGTKNKVTLKTKEKF